MKKVFVVIREMSAGNDSVGDMWKETQVFTETATLKDVMAWADPDSIKYDKPSQRNITLTKAEVSEEFLEEIGGALNET